MTSALELLESIVAIRQAALDRALHARQGVVAEETIDELHVQLLRAQLDVVREKERRGKEPCSP